MLTITRRYRFSASHRLHLAALSQKENTDLYGKCNNPYGHGHDYIVEVSCAGTPDAQTGLLLPLRVLDRLVEEQVLRLFAGKNINLDVPQFAALVPTTENIAQVIAGLLQRSWTSYVGPATASLSRVHVQETGRNGFEIILGTTERLSSPEHTAEQKDTAEQKEMIHA